MGNNTLIQNLSWDHPAPTSIEVNEQGKAKGKLHLEVSGALTSQSRLNVAKDMVAPAATDATEAINPTNSLAINLRKPANAVPTGLFGQELPSEDESAINTSSSTTGLGQTGPLGSKHKKHKKHASESGGSGDVNSDPTGPYNPFNIANQKECLIAIVANVMLLQAQTNSFTYSTFFQQASQAMNVQVQYAPLIAQNTITEYQAQANATLCDATIALKEGMNQMITFGASVAVGMGMGMYGAASEDATAAKTQVTADADSAAGTGAAIKPALPSESEASNVWETTDTDGTVRETTPQEKLDWLNENKPDWNAGEDGQPKYIIRDTSGNQVTADGRVTNASGDFVSANALSPDSGLNDAVLTEAGPAQGTTPATNAEQVDAETWSNKMKRWASSAGQAISKGSSYFGAGVMKAATISQGAMQASMAFNQYFIEAPQKTKQAAFQVAQGVAAAAAGEGQAYQQFYSQAFGRSNDMAQNSQSLIDAAVNTLQQAVNNITQVVMGMKFSA